MPKDGRVQVQSGILKLVVSMDDVVKIQKKKNNKLRIVLIYQDKGIQK